MNHMNSTRLTSRSLNDDFWARRGRTCGRARWPRLVRGGGVAAILHQGARGNPLLLVPARQHFSYRFPGEPRDLDDDAARVRRSLACHLELALQCWLDVHQSLERVVAQVLWSREPRYAVRPDIDLRAVREDDAPLSRRACGKLHDGNLAPVARTRPLLDAGRSAPPDSSRAHPGLARDTGATMRSHAQQGGRQLSRAGLPSPPTQVRPDGTHGSAKSRSRGVTDGPTRMPGRRATAKRGRRGLA
jgi:hypothetical protein